jgi:hypothetical protein
MEKRYGMPGWKRLSLATALEGSNQSFSVSYYVTLGVLVKLSKLSFVIWIMETTVLI